MPRFQAKAARRPDPIAAEPQSAEQKVIAAMMGALQYDPDEIIHPLIDPNQVAAEAIIMGQSLREYIPGAWNIVEPNTFIPNWHIDAIADHLQAVTNGDIKDLLITIPPRHSKSLIVAVLWATWEWTSVPSSRWVFASYAFGLSVRDSIKRRRIIQSPWYQDRWGSRYHLIEEQNTKIRYENNKQGFMLASSVGGSNTGEGGERIVVDDPHNIKKTESEDVRRDTVDWWNIVMSTRRNTAESARVVIQQRVHEGDVAGDIIERGGYVHLNLPTEFGYAGATRCTTTWTVKSTGNQHVFADPRTEEGELLNPARFGHDQNESAKLELGDYQYAAQHGQNPTPPKGAIIQAQWFKYYGGPTGVPIPDWTKATHQLTPLLSLDCTFKEHDDTDYVCGLGWAMFGADMFLLPLCIHKRMSFTGTIDAVAEFVGGKSLDGEKEWPGLFPWIKIKLVEDKANGSAVISTLQHRIAGMIPYDPRGASKASRLISCSWRFRSGNVYIPHESIAPWIKEYVYEMCAFPKAKKDDYVDATSQALLFIGGDPTITGEPVAPEQDSRWYAMARMGFDGQSDGEGRGESVWGNVGGRSIWRR